MKCELRHFIGMVNYYCEMWIRWSDVLTPLTHLTSIDAKWQWTETEKKAFTQIKHIISREVLLVYPDFNKPFDIHMDASHTQLGVVAGWKAHSVLFMQAQSHSDMVHNDRM